MKEDRVQFRRGSFTRCGWCGSYYSPEWVRILPGKPYCSYECFAASQIGDSKGEITQTNAGICCSASFIVIFSIFLIFMTQTALVWISCILLSLACSCISYGYSKRNQEARKYLYRKDMYRESYPFLIECGFCSHLNPPDALDCQHCDASLRDSQSVEGQIPEWFGLSIPKSQRECPHCGAVYVYELTAEKEMFLCQNCGKQFPHSTKS